MTFQYEFTKSGIQKIPAFDAYIRTTEHFESYIYEDPNLKVNTTQELTQEEQNTLGTSIGNYVDPEIFLILTSTIPDTTRSESTNSSTPSSLQTFIYSNKNPEGLGTFNAIKTVLEYSTSDVTQWSTFTGTLTATLSIYCYTRGITLSTNVIDLTYIANEWKEMALAEQTGSRSILRTFQIEGLRNVVASYDCLWNYIVSVSDSKLNARIHAKQMLYYDII